MWPAIRNMAYMYWRFIIVEIMCLANIKFDIIAQTFGSSFVVDRNDDILNLYEWQQAPMRGLICEIYLLQQYNVCFA